MLVKIINVEDAPNMSPLSLTYTPTHPQKKTHSKVIIKNNYIIINTGNNN